MPATERTASPPAKSGRGSLLLNLVLLLALAATGTGWYLSTRTVAAAAVASPQPLLPAPALYYALEPAFVVNLNEATFDSPQYLQVEVQLMTRDPRVHAVLAQHAPALRARLLLLFAHQTAAAIAGHAGKQRLQGEALEEVRTLLRAETGNDGIDALLFTSFITQ